jgi:hypothetical protein
MSRNLLKEAIADAKAIRESAIANAKAALEEAFTPHLKDMLAQRINELEEGEVDEAYHGKSKDEKSKEMEEGYSKKSMYEEEVEEGHMSDPVMRRGMKGDDAAERETEMMREEDEVDLEELLSEMADEVKEGEKEEVKEAAHEEEVETEETEEVETEEDAIDIEDMTEDELAKFVEEVIKDMVDAGELVAGEEMETETEEEEVEVTEAHCGSMEEDAETMEEAAHEKMEEAAHEKMEEAAHEKMEEGAHEEVEEGMHKDKMEEELSDSDVEKVDKEVDAVRDDLDQIAKLAKDAGEDAEDIKDVIDEDVNEDLKEAYDVISTLRKEINEVNLLNSKLLYTNKIFRNKNLTESQKVQVLNSFDKAETVKEVKLVFESLSTALTAKKSNIKESMGFASKPTGKAPIVESKTEVIHENEMVARFKKLAGL